MKLFEKLLILLLLIGMACSRHPIPVQELIPKTTEKEYKLIVTGVAQFNDFRDPRWKPFYRVGDERLSGSSIFVLVSGVRVCVVPMLVWSTRPLGIPVTCDWRVPHSTNRPEPIFRSE